MASKEEEMSLRLIYLLEKSTGDAHGSSLKAAWLSNDEANHLVKKFDEAFNNGDAAAVAALYTEDAV